MNATSNSNDAVSKLVKIWENKNAQRALRGAGLSTMAVSLAACGGGSSTTTTTTTTTTPTLNRLDPMTTDTDDVQGTSGNDELSAAINTSGAADYVDLGAGTDTFTLRMDADDALGVVEGAENIVIYARGDNGAAPVSFADVTGTTSVTLINGTTNFDLTEFDAAINLKFENSNDDYTVSYADLTGEADSQALELDGFEGNFLVGTTGLETLAITLSGDESDATITDQAAAAIETITITGAADATITLAAATDAVTSINAAVTGAVASGDITLDVDAVALDQDITGGAGADTFVFGSTLTTADEVDGGAGSDELTATLAAATTVRPTLANVELLDLDFTAAAELDLRNATGVTSVELEYSAAPTIENAASTLTSITIDEATANTDNLAVDYAAGADSAVTITVGGSDTDADNDVAVSVGDITVTDNAGALTITTTGEADNAIDAVTADDAASLTLNANTMGLTQTGALSAANATAASFIATADDLTAFDGAAATLTDATTVTVNAAGGSVTLGTITSDADATASISAGASDDNDVSIDNLDLDHATTVTIVAAAAADITLDTVTLAGIDSDGDDVDLEFDVTVAEDSVVTVSDITETLNGTETTIDLITVTGAGEFSFTANDADITVTEIDAALHTGVITIDLGTAINSAVDVTLGTGADHGATDVNTVTTGSAADTIVGGAGDDVIDANDGGNDITTGAGEDIVVVGHDGGQSIQDFTVGADADVIRIDISDAEADAAAGGSISVLGDGADVADGAAGSLLTIDGATDISASTANIMVIADDFANVGAMVDSLEVGGANVLTHDLVDDETLMAVFTNGTDAFVATISHAETDDDGDFEAGDLTGEVIATLIGVSDLTELVNGNFDFIA